MTNQASEDELDAILNRIISQETSREGGWAGYISDEKEYVESVPYGNELHNQQELKQALQDIIRTEKLKLLAEVRERVAGKDDLPITIDRKYNQFAKNSRNALRDEQRIELTKLEAEL